MRSLRLAAVGFLIVLLGAAGLEAQLIDEGFDAYSPGSPPPDPWWNWGTSGVNVVTTAEHRGPSGNSVAFSRLDFDGTPFAIGRNHVPPEGVARWQFFFRVSGAYREMLSFFGRDSTTNSIGPWVTVGFPTAGKISCFSNIGGWTLVRSIMANVWYGVRVEADLATTTYDITVWQDGSPTNTVTVTGIRFRDGDAAATLDEVQFGDFSSSTTPDSFVAYVDDVGFGGEAVADDNFESGDFSGWSAVVP